MSFFFKNQTKPSPISGNIMLALFAAIGAVGLVGATGMTVLKGPVRSMHNVTQKTIAENNIIASTKLAVMAAANQPGGGDCDADGSVEPVAWSNTGTGPKPTGGGYLPADIGASLQDPWGNTYGYCVWDHGTAIQTTCPTPTQRLQGTAGGGTVMAIISSGADRIFQTSCANAPTYVSKVSGSDDIVLSYTYAEAMAASGGLWNLQSGDVNTAEISKSLEVKDSGGDTTFELDRETGIGDFVGLRTGSIAAKGAEPVLMAGGLKMDNETNVTQCTLPQHAGTVRYHSTDGLQVCNGTEWVNAGGGKSVMPTVLGGLQIQSGTTATTLYTPTVELPKGVYFAYFYNCLIGASKDYFVSMSAEATVGTISAGATNRNYNQFESFNAVPFIIWVTSDTATVRFKVWNPDGGTLTSHTAANNCSSFNYYQLVAAGVDAGGGGGGGGGSLWTQLGAHIYYNSGNVGIGTMTPATKLHITGTDPTITLQDTRPSSNPALTAGILIKDSGGTSVGFMGDSSVGTNMMQFWAYADRIALGTALAHPITFHTNYNPSPSLDASERMRIAADGNVGIGTLAPTSKLSISGLKADIGMSANDTNEVALLSSFGGREQSRMALYFNQDGNRLHNNLYLGSAFELVDGVNNQAPTFKTAGSATVNPNILRIGDTGFRFLTSAAAAVGTNFVPQEVMAVLNTGNVGIGTGAATLSSKLTVNGYLEAMQSVDNAQSRSLLWGIATDTSNDSNNWNPGDPQLGTIGGANSGTNTLRLYGNQDRSLDVNITDGKLAIGSIKNAATQIHIMGREDVSPIMIDRPFYGPAIIMRNISGPGTTNSYPNVTERWEIYPSGAGAASADSYLHFVTRTSGGTATALMTIQNTGNVGIGIAPPAEKFHVLNGRILASNNANPASGAFGHNWARAFLAQSGYIWSTTDAANVSDANLYLGRHNTSHPFAYFGYGANVVGSISTNGSSTAYNTTSDYRLKDKITPLEHGLDKVLSLKPSQFVFKADKDAKEVDGFIAHEIQKVLPYAVTGEKDAVDKDGNPKYQHLDYSKLTPILTAAIQELKALFDDLLEKILSLTDTVQAMKSENEALRTEVDRLMKENKEMRSEFDGRLKALEASE